MFDYTRLGKILPFITQKTTIRIASNRRPSPLIWSLLKLSGIDPMEVTGIIPYLDKEDSNVKIFIVYGVTPQSAMLHDMIGGTHFFVIFADFLINEENFDRLCDICSSVVSVIAFYMVEEPCKKAAFVDDIYADNILERIKNIGLYNIWVALDHPIEFNDDLKERMRELDSALNDKEYSD